MRSSIATTSSMSPPSSSSHPRALSACRLRHRFTGRREGDLAAGAEWVEDRRRAVAVMPWTWLRQVHGAGVVTVTEPGEHAGACADASVTAVPQAVLAVQAADCAPVVLLGEAAVGVVHAGWRGLVDGVIEASVQAMRSLGSESIRAVIGPCIRSGCYEFGAGDLDAVVRALGPPARGRTTRGTASLNVAGAASAALRKAGVDVVEDVAVCTACSPDHWSWRARGDRQRQAAVAWLEK